MDNFNTTDSRITDSALRDLEKKIHFILAGLALNGLAYDGSSNVPGLSPEVMADAMEVFNSFASE